MDWTHSENHLVSQWIVGQVVYVTRFDWTHKSPSKIDSFSQSRLKFANLKSMKQSQKLANNDDSVWPCQWLTGILKFQLVNFFEEKQSAFRNFSFIVWKSSRPFKYLFKKPNLIFLLLALGAEVFAESYPALGVVGRGHTPTAWRCRSVWVKNYTKLSCDVAGCKYLCDDCLWGLVFATWLSDLWFEHFLSSTHQ